MDSPLDTQSSIDSLPTDDERPKRRSLIFNRRSIVSNREPHHESKKFKHQSETDSEPFDLQEYLDKLKREDEQWRVEYARRKPRTREEARHSRTQRILGQPLELDCLSDEQRAFLADKPDYQEFARDLIELHPIAVKVAFLNRSAEHFYDEALLKTEKDTAEAARRIMDMSD